MARHTLYAYVEGADLQGVAVALQAALDRFVQGRRWTCAPARVVNQRHEPDPSAKAGDLPPWDLGLNLTLPDPGNEPAGWFADVEAVALFLADMTTTTGRQFVIGIDDAERGFNEDLFSIATPDVDLTLLRAVIGVGEVD